MSCIGPRTRSKMWHLTATFKAFILDEAWIFLRNRTIRDYITRAEKTWRKKNAAMILATQSVHELISRTCSLLLTNAVRRRFFWPTPASITSSMPRSSTSTTPNSICFRA